MNFQRLELKHIDLLRPFFKMNESRICDCTLGGTFMWRDFFNTRFCIEDGILFFRVSYFNGADAFPPPMGEHNGEPYGSLISHCRSENIPVRLCSVSKQCLERILAIYPDAKYRTDPAWSDYVYNSTDLATLAGRRYSGQRNHVNRFIRENPDWSFEKIDGGNIAAVREYFVESFKAQPKDSATYNEGNAKTLEILDNYESYNAVGGTLRVGGRIIGASIGEIMGDTLFVHTERSDLTVPGSYQILTRSFSEMFSSDKVKYINREEDDGDEGLRTAKMSYHPAMLLEKYFVEI